MLVLQAFSGKHPWPDVARPEQVLLALALRTVHPPPSENARCAGLTDAWWEVCLDCWAYRPSERPTMRQVWDMLRGIHGESMVPEQDSPKATLPKLLWVESPDDPVGGADALGAASHIASTDSAVPYSNWAVTLPSLAEVLPELNAHRKYLQPRNNHWPGIDNETRAGLWGQ